MLCREGGLLCPPAPPPALRMPAHPRHTPHFLLPVAASGMLFPISQNILSGHSCLSWCGIVFVGCDRLDFSPSETLGSKSAAPELPLFLVQISITSPSGDSKEPFCKCQGHSFGLLCRWVPGRRSSRQISPESCLVSASSQVCLCLRVRRQEAQCWQNQGQMPF